MAIIYDMGSSTIRTAPGRDDPTETHNPVPAIEPALEPAVANLEEHQDAGMQDTPSVHVIRATLEKLNKF